MESSTFSAVPHRNQVQLFAINTVKEENEATNQMFSWGGLEHIIVETLARTIGDKYIRFET